MPKEAYTTEAVSNEFIHLNSCGKQTFFARSASASRPNGRKDYHILYIVEGSCYVKIGENTIDADAGSLILFLPGEPQLYSYYEGKRTTAYYAHFSGTECQRLLSSFSTESKRVYKLDISGEIIELFEKMKREYELSLPESDTLCAGYLISILALFNRASGSFASITAKHKKITEICQYIQTAYSEQLTVSALAQRCYLSESRFSHLFREMTKKSPMEYITDLRIQKAKDLLVYSDYSVSEIGITVGFESIYYFSRAFKKRVGSSPRKYRDSFSV